MHLRHIENVIESIDPYNAIKDIGIPIFDNSDNSAIYLDNSNNLENISSDLYACKINNRLIRILPYGFLNIDAYRFTNDFSKEEPFIAGTVIDFLAFYLGGSYDEAFKLFFSYYSSYLKEKLVQEPAYLEKLVKPNFVKRQNILKFIVKRLCIGSENDSNTILCRSWAARHGISSINRFGFYATSKDIYNMLNYFSQNTLVDYYDAYEQKVQQADPDQLSKALKIDNSLPFNDFINNHLFVESKEWVVIPYFADFHIVSGLKFINPHDDTYYISYLEESKLNYAGIYTIDGKFNFAATKIRILESDIEALTLSSYVKRMMSNDFMVYLSVMVNNSGSVYKSNINNMSKPMFLYKTNSNFPLIRSIYDSLINKNTINCDLYVCSYENYKESPISYTYTAFIEKEFKNLITKEYQGLNPTAPLNNQALLKLNYFMNACNIDGMELVKKNILKWLYENSYLEIYKKLTEVKPETVDFKGYAITSTPNGYICEYKNEKTNDKIAITNFIIKIDQNVVFADNDDMLHFARVIMSNIEYPLIFYKKDLKKRGDSIEQLALKAFTNVTNTVIDDQIDHDSGYMLPVVFEMSFGSALYTILKHEINKAPCKYGISKLGWDKVNGNFNSLAWQANIMKISFRKQYIHSVLLQSNEALPKDMQKCFSNLPLPILNEKLSTGNMVGCIRDSISILLAYFYRTYFNFDTIPVIAADNATTRNLFRFVFAALGQISPYQAPNNLRLIKSGKLLSCLNKYPIYLRCDNQSLSFIKHMKEDPFIILIQPGEIQNYNNSLGENETPLDIFSTTNNFTKETYKQITQFAQDTFDRFFKWFFTVGMNEFELEKQECNSQQQLIEEGQAIFRQLWYKEVYRACSKEISPAEALASIFSHIRRCHVRACFMYYPEEDCYILRRTFLPEEAFAATALANKIFKVSGVGGFLMEKDSKVQSSTYMWLKKSFVEGILPTIRTLDDKPINIDTDTRIFVSRKLAVTPNRYNGPLRCLYRTEFYKRCQTMPEYQIKCFDKYRALA